MCYPSNRQLEQQRHEEEVARAILRYLAEHPQAMDTLEGITEWWLIRQQIRVEVRLVAGVLRRLTESGLLEESRTGGDARYRLKVQGKSPEYVRDKRREGLPGGASGERASD
jgi:DNA-binding transcriptional ArsR family regulator